MFGSEVLDAAAIGAGAAVIGGIVAGFFAWLTKKQEIQAKRSELAFEKRLEALREIFEIMNDYNKNVEEYDINYNTIGLYALFGDGDEYINGNIKMKEGISNIKSKFLSVYHKNRIYLPRNIDDRIRAYIKEVLVDAGDSTREPTEGKIAMDLRRAMTTKERLTEDVVSEMQTFIGFK